MPRSEASSDDIIPAHLDFLTIFCPELGQTDENEKEQILFYWSRPLTGRKNKKRQQDAEQLSRHASEEEHERMRQTGLAQGMVNFARTFGSGKDIDSIDTEKHRIVLKQLERGWWILASICLTRIPTILTPNAPDETQGGAAYEYSAREVNPPILLVQELLRAHRIFLLHHGQTLSDVYVRLPRHRFSSILAIYWTRFVREWDVLLHGNPLANAYTAIRLPAAGELGVGVGEEEWGSGERDYLEGLIAGTEGLVDMVVLRTYCKQDVQQEGNQLASPEDLGDSEDLACGVVFSGCSTLTRKSVVALSEWMQHVASHPSTAYGVQENPSSTRPRPQKSLSSIIPEIAESRSNNVSLSTSQLPANRSDAETIDQARSPIPPSILSVVEGSLERATSSAGKPKESASNYDRLREERDPGRREDSPHNDWRKYFTFGYGSTWGASAPVQPGNEVQKDDPSSQSTKPSNKLRSGRFLVGLAGPLDQEVAGGEQSPSTRDLDGSRVSVRTVHVELTETVEPASGMLYPERSQNTSRSPSPNSKGSSKSRRLRLLLYQDYPFIYTLLFEPTTASLTMETVYRTLHQQLQTLYRSLEASTSLQRVKQRLVSTIPDRNDSIPIYDLLFESSNMTLQTSIPRIPPIADELVRLYPYGAPWTRLEALNVHMQALASIAEARVDAKLQDSNVKTHRDWWVLWMRQQLREPEKDTAVDTKLDLDTQTKSRPEREAILIKRSTDEVSTQRHRVSNSFGQLSSNSSAEPFRLGKLIGRDTSSGTSARESLESASSSSPRKASEGIGVDARKYVESLFHLNR